MKNPQTLTMKILSAAFQIAALVLCLPATDASAKLGGDLASIQADATGISGTLEPAREKDGYSVYVIRSSDHHVRALIEYLSQDGVVVAIAASSRGNINARNFVEPEYFEKTRQARMASLAPKSKGRAAHGRVMHQDIVIETSGHRGNMVLRAFLPQRLPAALTEDMISPGGEP